MFRKETIIGWIASFCFMFSGAPAALEALTTKQCTIPIGTLILWTVGEICAVIYILPRKDKPLLANYLVNLVFLSVMWFYK